MFQHKYTNNLIHEKSPYLLQHAHNPVDWFPWGQEAFDKAKAEDKPIFLSIGYSTCHWCHVMAHESFEDESVATILNDHFISIKVDREERSDIDAVYMSACQAVTGSGGWPLTAILTPYQKPFFLGTYIPKTTRYGMLGLKELLIRVVNDWQENRQKLIETGDTITNHIQSENDAVSGDFSLSAQILDDAKEVYFDNYDVLWGGFGRAPKFPTPHNLLFLIRYAKYNDDINAINMVEHTLKQMYKGGMFDHIGGGFSRYSTDEKWLVPHFEKMLYDNALLTYAYLECFEFTQNPLYLHVAQKTITYVINELTDESGAFYSGQDADSDGVEGKYYVFSKNEIIDLLGMEKGQVFCDWFGITDKGNFEGKNIPNMIENSEFGESNILISELCKIVYEYRTERTHLHRDDKVLTSWNALMIAALAKAARVTDNEKYLSCAIKAKDFIANNLKDDKGNLYVRWREGQVAHMGQLDDYAFYGFALLELYDTTFDIVFLKETIEIAEKILNLFADEKGGLYLYSSNSEQLISRPKEVYDGAMPSGNSVVLNVFMRLARLTGEHKWQEAFDRQLSFVSSVIKEYPTGYSFSLMSLMNGINSSYDLICVTDNDDIPQEIKTFFRDNYLLNVMALVKTKSNQDKLKEIAPFTENYLPKDGQTLYYLCENKSCMAPVADINELLSNFT